MEKFPVNHHTEDTVSGDLKGKINGEFKSNKMSRLNIIGWLI
jgi:hypothetical protein